MKKTHIPKTPRPPPTAEKIHNPIREEIHVVQMESLINLRRTTELLKKSHTPQKTLLHILNASLKRHMTI